MKVFPKNASRSGHTSDTEILDTPHTQAWIDNSLLIAQRPHLTSPTRMIRSSRLFLHILLPFLIILGELASLRPRSLDVVLRASAFSDNFVDVFDAFGEDCEIERVGEVVVVDDGFVEWIGGAETNGAETMWGHEHSESSKYRLVKKKRKGVSHGTKRSIIVVSINLRLRGS